MSLPFFTIGHSTRTIPEFVRLLQAAEVELVADIRTVPRSRANPQYNRDVLPENLARFQIAYEYLPELGGLRGKARDVADDVNAFWENRSFHNYADYALSKRFHDGVEKLVTLGRERRTAIMCSEAVWWRCHRRIVADYLLIRGESVFHLMGEDRIEPAKITEGAQSQSDDRVVYPAVQE